MHLPVNELMVDEEALRAQEGPDFPPGVPEEAKDGTKRNMLGPSLLEASATRRSFCNPRRCSAGPRGCEAQVRVVVRDRAQLGDRAVEVRLEGDELWSRARCP